ncbi:MAG: hypothetical protein D6759_13195, partial [Chloroflexi bacterium]
MSADQRDSDLVEALLRQLQKVPVEADEAFRARLRRRWQQEAQVLFPAPPPRRSRTAWAPFRRRTFLAVAGGLVALALLLLAALLGPLPGRADSWATLLVQSGVVEVKQQRSYFLGLRRDEEITLTAGQSLVLRAGARLQTDGSAQARILFFDGSTTELGPNTRLSLVTVRPGPGNRGGQVILTLEMGSTTHQVERRLGPDDRFEVRIPFAVTTVQGTRFHLTVYDERRAYLATDEGTVRVEMGEQQAQVPAGYEVELIAGHPLVVRPQAPEMSIVLPDGTVAHPGD